MTDRGSLIDESDPSLRDTGTAALLRFPSAGSVPSGDGVADRIGHGSTSLFDRLGHLLGLDASIRRWMLADRLAALIGLGISPDDALVRLSEVATSDAERGMLDRAAEHRNDGGGLADALAAAGGYPAAGIAALRDAADPAAEAAALAGIAATLRRRLTLRYSLALGGAALTAILALLLFQHRPADQPMASEPIAAPAIVARTVPAPRASVPHADLAPVLGPGLSGAPPPLVGIVGRLPDDAVALVKMPSGRTRTLAVGAVFDGWTLASLDADEAVFSRAGQRVTVALPPADGQ